MESFSLKKNKESRERLSSDEGSNRIIHHCEMQYPRETRTGQITLKLFGIPERFATWLGLTGVLGGTIQYVGSVPRDVCVKKPSVSTQMKMLLKDDSSLK